MRNSPALVTWSTFSSSSADSKNCSWCAMFSFLLNEKAPMPPTATARIPSNLVVFGVMLSLPSRQSTWLVSGTSVLYRHRWARMGGCWLSSGKGSFLSTLSWLSLAPLSPAVQYRVHYRLHAMCPPQPLLFTAVFFCVFPQCPAECGAQNRSASSLRLFQKLLNPLHTPFKTYVH